jgi:hypothetical protein
MSQDVHPHGILHLPILCSVQFLLERNMLIDHPSQQGMGIAFPEPHHVKFALDRSARHRGMGPKSGSPRLPDSQGVTPTMFQTCEAQRRNQTVRRAHRRLN